MPRAGLEPALPKIGKRILSPLCLPNSITPALRHNTLRARCHSAFFRCAVNVRSCTAFLPHFSLIIIRIARFVNGKGERKRSETPHLRTAFPKLGNAWAVVVSIVSKLCHISEVDFLHRTVNTSTTVHVTSRCVLNSTLTALKRHIHH